MRKLTYFSMSLKSVTNDIFRDISALGGAFFAFLAIIISLLLFRSIALALLLLSGIIILLGMVLVIRLVYFKPRPHKQPYNSLIEKIDASSFPSLHSARAAFFAIVLGIVWGVGISGWLLLTMIAGLVAYSRIYLQKHDIIDVCAGSAMGIIIGLAAIKILKMASVSYI